VFLRVRSPDVDAAKTSADVTSPPEEFGYMNGHGGGGGGGGARNGHVPPTVENNDDEWHERVVHSCSSVQLTSLAVRGCEFLDTKIFG